MDAMGVLGAAAAGQVAAHLPWGWYAGLAAVDIGLVGLFARQRSRSRSGQSAPRIVGAGRPTAAASSIAGPIHVADPAWARLARLAPVPAPAPVAATVEVELAGRVRQSGWWIPSARADSAPASQATYQWPVRRDYLLSRLG